MNIKVKLLMVLRISLQAIHVDINEIVVDICATDSWIGVDRHFKLDFFSNLIFDLQIFYGRVWMFWGFLFGGK